MTASAHPPLPGRTHGALRYSAVRLAKSGRTLGRMRAGFEDRNPSPPRGDSAAPGMRANAEQPEPATERFFRDALGVPIDKFLQNIVGQQIHGPHPSAARLRAADLAAMADVDYVMGHARFRGSDAQPIRSGVAQADKSTTDAGALADAAYIYRQFAKGSSIRFLGVQRFLPGVSGFAAELAAALAEPVGANIYITPANGEGLSLHYDPHDVFVLQCVGSKTWRLYEAEYANARERPTGADDTFDPKQHQPGPVDRDVRMTPGDILYLPRGSMHEVASPSADSLHITFSVRTLTVAELVRRALSEAIADAEGLRAPISHAVRMHAAVDDQFAAHLAAELAAALSTQHLAAALEKYRDECRRAAKLAPAEHWFGSHGYGAEGAARLGAAVADRVRSLGLRGSAALQPKRQPKQQG